MERTTSQKLFSHGGIYVLVRLSDRATGFVLMPIYAAYLGEEGYGALALITTTVALVMTVAQQGQIGAWGRLRYGLNEAERRDLETSVFWYATFSVALFVSLLSVFGEGLARKFLPGVDFDFIRMGLVAAALKLPLMFYNRTLQEAQKPRGFLFLNVTSTIINTALIVVFVAGIRLGLFGVLLAQLVTGLILFVGAFSLLKPRYPWNMRGDLVAQGARFGLPIVGHTLANTTNAFADRVMVNYLIGASATGNYAMGYKLASLIGLAGTALNQAFNPLLNQGLTRALNADQPEKERIWASIRKAALYQIAMVALMGLAISAGGRELIFILAKGRFEAAWQVISIVAAGTLLIATYQPFACSLIYAKRTKQLSIVSGTGAVVNILLNWVLIPQVGMIGAAIATFCSSLAFLVLIWLLTRNVFQPLVGQRWLILLGVAMSCMGALVWADWAIDSWWTRVPLKLLLLGGGAGTILALTGARPKDLRNALKRPKNLKKEALPKTETGEDKGQ